MKLRRANLRQSVKIIAAIALGVTVLPLFFIATTKKPLFVSTPETSQPFPPPSIKTGIWGGTIVTGVPPTPETPNLAILPNCEVVVISLKDHKKIKRFRSDAEGRFALPLPPGKYVLYPQYTDLPKADPWKMIKTGFTVQRGKMMKVEAS